MLSGELAVQQAPMFEGWSERYHYDSHNQLRTYLASFITAYNFARRHKTSSALRHANTSAKMVSRTQTFYTQSTSSNARTQCLESITDRNSAEYRWVILSVKFFRTPIKCIRNLRFPIGEAYSNIGICNKRLFIN